MSATNNTMELPLARHLSVLVKMYYGALTKRLEHLEIERYFTILIFVEKNNVKCTQQYISDKLKIDKASMVRMIDDLVTKNYLVRTVNPNDRREHWISITSKAKKIMPIIHKEIKALNKIALNGLSENEQTVFNNAMCLIYQNLEQLPADRVFVNYKKAKK